MLLMQKQKELRMTKEQFLKIRLRYIGTQKRCADLLGMNVRAVLRYEKGESEIPWPVAIIMLLVAHEPAIITTIEHLSKLD